MLYHFHDLRHAMLTPARLMAEATHQLYNSPLNPLSQTPLGKNLAAGAKLFERATRRFEEPDFGLHETIINGKEVQVTEEIILEKSFCTLVHFKRNTKRNDPKILIAAPMSGHFATLLRGTVEALLPHHDVYITDWIDAKQVPLSEGVFNLDSYIAYLRDFLTHMGPKTHVIAVCQPAVPVFAVAALMEAEKSPNAPASMILMGGPIDTRISKTQVTELAEERPLSWFKNTVTTHVPQYYPGGNRKVYPGFLQLSGFMSMNLDRHVDAHMDFYQHLVEGDGDSADKHRKFYDEYLSVMDIDAEFYLQTVEIVFQKHLLPKGKMIWTDPDTGKKHAVDPSKIKKTALLTVEGELDDISAHGQTTAAHTLCTNLPANRQYHHFQENAGHYGIFNGTRWRTWIMPRIRHFIRDFDKNTDPLPKGDLKKIPDLAPPQWDEKKHSLKAVKEHQRKKAKKEARTEDILQAHE